MHTHISRRSFIQGAGVVGAGVYGVDAVRADEDVRTIAYGETKTGEVDLGDPTDYGSFHYEPVDFSGTAGDQIRIRMQSQDFRPVVSLEDPAGEFLTIAAEPATITQTLPATGAYTIRAWATPQRETGSYTLSLTRQSSDGVLTGTVEASFGDLGRCDVQLFAVTEDQWERHPERIAATVSDTDGTFAFDNISDSDLPSLRDKHDLILIHITERDGPWFRATFDRPSDAFGSLSYGRLTVTSRHILEPTLVESNSGTGDASHGAVSIWSEIPGQNQRDVFIEYTVTSGETAPWDIYASAGLNNGTFSLTVPESGIEVDYSTLGIDVWRIPATVPNSLLTRKWHPLHDELETPLAATLIPGRPFGMYDEYTSQDREFEEDRKRALEASIGFVPVVGTGYTLVSYLSDMFDINSGIDEVVGNGNGDEPDRNRVDIAKAGWTGEALSVRARFPVRFTEAGSKQFVARGLWTSSRGGNIQLDHAFSLQPR